MQVVSDITYILDITGLANQILHICIYVCVYIYIFYMYIYNIYITYIYYIYIYIYISHKIVYSEKKNFTNNILRLLGVKHTKLYSFNLS